MSPWEWTFWLSAAFVAYTYIGYPALLVLWRKLHRQRQLLREGASYPLVSIIVTARNEEDHIEAKLSDLLNQDYPEDRIEIWVASDQSTDGTNERVLALQQRYSRICLVDYQENIGKSEAINRTVPLTRGEILLFSDARQHVHKEAVSRMVRHFHDPRVGIVGAEMTLVNEEGKPSGECTGVYWRYERALRRLESSLDLLAGVSGAFFAMRKSAFRPIPPGSYCEDVTLALYARSEGLRVVWEPGACVEERVRDSVTEFRRKVRTLVGNYQLLSQFWPLYLPWRGKLAFTLVSHKLCRLFIPLALALVLAASVALAPTHWFYALALAGQLALYGAGVLGLLLTASRKSRLVTASAAFCMLNWAALVALFHVLRHGPRIQWR